MALDAVGLRPTLCPSNNVGLVVASSLSVTDTYKLVLGVETREEVGAETAVGPRPG